MQTNIIAITVLSAIGLLYTLFCLNNKMS